MADAASEPARCTPKNPPPRYIYGEAVVVYIGNLHRCGGGKHSYLTACPFCYLFVDYFMRRSGSGIRKISIFVSVIGSDRPVRTRGLKGNSVRVGGYPRSRKFLMLFGHSLPLICDNREGVRTGTSRKTCRIRFAVLRLSGRKAQSMQKKSLQRGFCIRILLSN